MTEEERITRAYKLLNDRDFENARKLFAEILREEPHYIPALRGALFCDLKINRFSQIKGLSSLDIRKRDLQAFETAATSDYSGYFSGLDLLNNIEAQRKILILNQIELRELDQRRQEELDSVSAVKARERLFTTNHTKVPLIIGPIIYFIFLFIIIGNVMPWDNPLYERLLMIAAMSALPFFFSVPAMVEMEKMISAPKKRAKIEESYDGLDERIKDNKIKLDMLDEDYTKLYRDLFEKDSRIQAIVDKVSSL